MFTIIINDYYMEVGKMKVENKNYIQVFSEIGHVMCENDTDNVELEISTPGGTVIFEITMRIKEEKKYD